MSRDEYFMCLDGYLRKLSDEERKEAIQYYEDYFDEAGPENEQSIINNLGSPKELAQSIIDGNRAGEFTENGYKRNSESQNSVIPASALSKEAGSEGGAGTGSGNGNYNNGSYNTGSYNNGSYTGAYDNNANNNGNNNANNNFEGFNPSKDNNESGSSDTWRLILGIVILVVAAPILLSILGSLIGIVVSLALGALGLVIGGVVVLVIGIIKLFSSIGIGMMIMGTAMVLGALGIINALILDFLFKVVFPLIIKVCDAYMEEFFGARK